jgi:phosphatidylglycerophosphatase A
VTYAQQDRRTVVDWIVLSLGTGMGLGMSPVMPGTVGCLAAVALAGCWHHIDLATPYRMTFVGVMFIMGIPVAARSAKLLRRDDPGAVVIDEIVALGLIYACDDFSIGYILTGFVWFRVFDIAKPWPVGWFDRLHGGLGIMLDDVAAALYALLAVQLTMQIVG